MDKNINEAKEIRELVKVVFNESRKEKENILDFFVYLKKVYIEVMFHPNIAYVRGQVIPNTKKEKIKKKKTASEKEKKRFYYFIIDLEACSFLNKIPKDEWDINIYEILRWGQGYFREPIFKKGHTKREKSTEITSHVNSLKRAKKVIETFLPKETGRTISNNGTVFIDYEGMPIHDTTFMKDLYTKLEKAIEDIEKKKFNIFPSEYYEGSKASEKNDLEDILKDIAKKYNISPYADDIKHMRSLLEARK